MGTKEDTVGKWVFDEKADAHKCSLCGEEALCDAFGTGYILQVLSSYCPHCGSEMDQE